MKHRYWDVSVLLLAQFKATFKPIEKPITHFYNIDTEHMIWRPVEVTEQYVSVKGTEKILYAGDVLKIVIFYTYDEKAGFRISQFVLVFDAAVERCIFSFTQQGEQSVDYVLTN
ncbi:hypothetical protein RF11_05926 [Thelohanellus kitauei]|uniref:Uncharacterized protein n=1 Tax=Thelohanellus kitauei TaxID=669202 RepID=A0A0C2NE68_THEKT|nr:hypothetical protein RF11_05926 [Thelohanellus kitauei]